MADDFSHLDNDLEDPSANPRYPQNPFLHATVISAFAEADPGGKYYISPNVVAETMWRVETELTRRKITEPRKPFWIEQEKKSQNVKGDDSLDVKKLEVRQRRELEEYDEAVIKHEERVDQMCGNVVRSFGLAAAAKWEKDALTRGTLDSKGKAVPSRPRSVQDLLIQGMDLYREWKHRGSEYKAKRGRFIRDVLTEVQVDIARYQAQKGDHKELRSDTVPGALFTILSMFLSEVKETDQLMDAWNRMNVKDLLKKFLPGDHPTKQLEERGRGESEHSQHSHHSHHSQHRSRSPSSHHGKPLMRGARSSEQSRSPERKLRSREFLDPKDIPDQERPRRHSTGHVHFPNSPPRDTSDVHSKHARH